MERFSSLIATRILQHKNNWEKMANVCFQFSWLIHPILSCSLSPILISAAVSLLAEAVSHSYIIIFLGEYRPQLQKNPALNVLNLLEHEVIYPLFSVGSEYETLIQANYTCRVALLNIQQICILSWLIQILIIYIKQLLQDKWFISFIRSLNLMVHQRWMS